MFKVGQMVTIGAEASDGPSAHAAREYKVLGLLLTVDGARAYRVKSIKEPESRVVLEVDCHSTTPAVPQLPQLLSGRRPRGGDE